jgi:hypothetical protein
MDLGLSRSTGEGHTVGGGSGGHTCCCSGLSGGGTAKRLHKPWKLAPSRVTTMPSKMRACVVLVDFLGADTAWVHLFPVRCSRLRVVPAHEPNLEKCWQGQWIHLVWGGGGLRKSNID